MVYSCALDPLFNALERASPQEVAWLRANHRFTRHGMLSVGIKLHVLPSAREDFVELARALKGTPKPRTLGEGNVYKAADAHVCVVLPPVGSADAALRLVDAIAAFIGSKIWGSTEIQVQVCSPGRLSVARTAILGAVAYLGSNGLKSYGLSVSDLRTTVEHDERYMRTPRLVLYDGYNVGGGYDPNYGYWDRSHVRLPHILPRLPFERGRSDVLAGCAFRNDIENVNLAATLLVHAQYGGYWADIGRAFEQDVAELFARHDLSTVLEAPWVSTGPGESMDATRLFAEALTELVSYAFSERDRILAHPDSEPGILFEMQDLLRGYRSSLHTIASTVLLQLEGGTST